MVKELLKEVFEKLLNENENNNKTKNGCSVYFVNEILEKKYNAPYIISERTFVDYYNKHVLGKSNKSSEPNSKLKNLMANYLGFEGYSSYETSKKALSNSKKTQVLKLNRFIITTFLLVVIAFVYGFSKNNKRCNFCSKQIRHTKEYHINNIQVALYPLEIRTVKKKSKTLEQLDDTSKPIFWYSNKESNFISNNSFLQNIDTTESEAKQITDSFVIPKSLYLK
jgi:hypothetical protein